MRVCRQILNETLPIFYGENTFFVKSINSHGFLQTVGEASKHVKKIAFYLDFLLAGLVRSLFQLRRLRELYLDVDDNKLQLIPTKYRQISSSVTRRNKQYQMSSENPQPRKDFFISSRNPKEELSRAVSTPKWSKRRRVL